MESLDYQLIRSKRRTIALEIDEQGQLIVRAPLRSSVAFIQGFINQKKFWIDRNQLLIKSRGNPDKKQYKTGESFLFLGQTYSLEVIHESNHKLQLTDSFLLGSKQIPKAETSFVNWYKKQSLIKLTELVNQYAAIMQLRYQTIKISSAKKRWGSCSCSGVLNFSWRLIMAPQFVVEYVVVHELAHIKELNHSKKFWQIVAGVLPGYTSARKWLKDHGHLLTL